MEEDRIRVLLVDDDQGDFAMTRAMIAQIHSPVIELDWVSTYEEGIDALKEGEHDVYLVDYFLEDRTGLELLREARERSIRAPLIMLTGRGSREVDVEAMRAGAADYLVKGRVDPEILERAIRFAMERSRSERALRDSAERYRGTFDRLPIGLYRASPDGEIVEVNPALVRILGHPDAETLRTTYAPRLFVGPEDGDRLWKLLERNGVARGFESRVRRADGREIRIRSSARIHRNGDDTIALVEGSLEEVTGARGAPEEADPGERFRRLFEEVGAGTALVDLRGLLTDVNPAFVRLLGRGPDETLGRCLVDLAVEDDRRELGETFRAVARGDRDRDVAERRWALADGRTVRAATRLCLIRNRRGEPDHVLTLLETASEPR